MYTYLYYYHYKYTLAFPVYYYIYIIHVLYHIRILCIVPCNKLMNCFTFLFYCVWVKIYVPLGVYLWVKIYVPLGVY